jgi:hypothetical protein
MMYTHGHVPWSECASVWNRPRISHARREGAPDLGRDWPNKAGCRTHGWLVLKLALEFLDATVSRLLRMKTSKTFSTRSLVRAGFSPLTYPRGRSTRVLWDHGWTARTVSIAKPFLQQGQKRSVPNGSNPPPPLPLRESRFPPAPELGDNRAIQFTTS